jgi:hypothetical protein
MNLVILYKNKYRKIHVGKKGGHYLIINKKKHYLTHNKVLELLKNKKKDDKIQNDKEKLKQKKVLKKNKKVLKKNKKVLKKNKKVLKKNKKVLKKNKKVLEPNIVISYNLHWRTQKDKIDKSKINHVKDCIKKYGEKAVPYKKLSGCTQRLGKGLYMFNKRNPHNMFDILCIQEGTKEYTELLFKIINKHSRNKYDFHISRIVNECLGVMYKRIFGKPVEIYKGSFKNYKDRPIQILYFKKIDLVLINAHFPHNIKIKSLVKDNILPHISKYINNSRIIFCGDFNDYHLQLVKGKSAELKLKDVKMKIKNVEKVKSCCYDTDFDSNCDYIFDSKKIKFFGIIPEFNEIALASDHKPVMSINNLPVIFKE